MNNHIPAKKHVTQEGYIQLTPRVAFSTTCPRCVASVDAHDWRVTGMWTVAHCICSKCGCEFLEDLPYSLGVVSPCVLDLTTGIAKPRYSGQWYANATASAWNKRGDFAVNVRAVRNPVGRTACLVNCLYPWWGDAVSLLLRINQLRSTPNMEIVVLINPAMRWLVPEDVPGVWEVTQGVLENGDWREGIDRGVKAIAHSLGLTLYLPIIFQPAYLTPAEVYTACKIQPFPREQWIERLKTKPTVTFMWRTDRAWSDLNARRSESRIHSVLNRIRRRVPLLSESLRVDAAAEQVRNLNSLASELLKVFPNIEFAVCGLDSTGTLASCIKDLRVNALSGETDNLWAEQCARSHVFVGVHGSHTTPFGSLAGSCIELTPNDRLRNIMQCSPITSREPRDAIYCNRFLPINTDPFYLADVILSVMLNYSYARVAFEDAYYKPQPIATISELREQLHFRSEALRLESIQRGNLAN